MPILQRLDFIQPTVKKEQLAFGGCLTLFVGIALLAASVIIVIGALDPPLTTSTLTEWSYGGVYPIVIHCQAKSGCLVSQLFSGISEGSKLCREALSDELVKLPGNGTGGSNCYFLAPDQKKKFNLCYSSLPADGLSTTTKLGEEGELGALGLPNEFGFVVWSDVLEPDGTVKKMKDPFHHGQNSLLLVKTLNTSFSTAQETRHEWFSQLTDTEAFLPDQTSPECDKLTGKLKGSGKTVLTRLKMQASFVFVDVTQTMGYFALIGELGGVAKVFLTVAVGLSLIYRKRLDAQEGKAAPGKEAPDAKKAVELHQVEVENSDTALVKEA